MTTVILVIAAVQLPLVLWLIREMRRLIRETRP